VSTSQSLLLADRYRLLHPLGEGGMGRVWRARDETLHRDVAIKELVAPPGLTPAERKELQARSMREARAIARLSHPNVVRIFDVVEVGDGDPWIVMEYLPGQSLDDAMDAGSLPVRRVARIGLEILQALHAAHRLGVVHRDVKPGNILLATDGRAVLTDFGIATVPGDPYVTRTGLLLGSPAYLAPERARPGTTSTVSDLWSLGATLYAATEGRPPFARPTTIETLAALASEPVPPPQRSGPLTSVLIGLLRKDPAERMDSATAQRLLRQALGTPATAGVTDPADPAAGPDAAAVTGTRALPTAPVATPPPPQPRAPQVPLSPAPKQRPDYRRWLFAAVAALAVLAAVSLVLIDRGDQLGQAPPQGGTPASGLASATAQPPSPPRSTAGSPSGFQLPAGWQMREDGTGFRVPVPDGWQFGRDPDGRAQWQDPTTNRLLLIDQTREPKPDPLQDWENNEQARRDGYEDYQRVRLEAVSYWDSAADWEFTYTLGGTPVHVLNRNVITASDQAYSIYWRTPADTWEDNREELQVVLDGFVPARS
jgi:eukaryotic-like serine/threonine-protein kinase